MSSDDAVYVDGEFFYSIEVRFWAPPAIAQMAVPGVERPLPGRQCPGQIVFALPSLAGFELMASSGLLEVSARGQRYALDRLDIALDGEVCVITAAML